MLFRAALLMGLALMAPLTWANEPVVEDQLPRVLAEAAQSNPDILAAHEEAQAARRALPIARSEGLPQISTNISANHLYRSEPAGPFVREQPEYWIASISTSWLLFSGGRIGASTDQARAEIARAAARYKDIAQGVLLEVVRSYADVLEARASKEAQDRALENLREQLRYVEANVRQGFLTETDRAQARARVEQARSDLATANARVVSATEAFARRVGRTPSALATPTSPNLPTDLQSALAQAKEYSPTLLAAAAELESANAAYDAARSSGRLRAFLETNNAAFEALSTDRLRRESEDSVSVRVSIPLFTGGAVSARTGQQRSLRSAARYSLEAADREVIQSVSTAWAALEAARARVQATASRLEAAELAQRGMQREQRAGTRSTIDALNQEQELLAARVELARAQRDVTVGEYELAAATGQLLDGINAASVASLKTEAATAVASAAHPKASRKRSHPPHRRGR